MSDYPAQIDAARRRLQALSDVPFATPQPESLAPRWYATAEGLAYLEALHRGAQDEAVNIYDAAYGRALDDWTTLLWLAPMPAKEDAP